VMLLKLKEEVAVCLERLDSAVDGLLGSGPKLKFVDVKQAQCAMTGPKNLLKIPSISRPNRGVNTFKVPVGKETSRPKGGFVLKDKTPVYREISRPNGGFMPKPKGVLSKVLPSLGLGVDQASHNLEPKGKARISEVQPICSSSPSLKGVTRSWVSLDAGQPGDPGSSSFAGGSPIVRPTPVPFPVSVPVGLAVCPLSVGYYFGGSSGELSVAVASLDRVQLKQSQLVSAFQTIDLIEMSQR
jgi:hypothetical protein